MIENNRGSRKPSRNSSSYRGKDKSFESKSRFKSNDREFGDRSEKKFSRDSKPYSDRKSYGSKPDFNRSRSEGFSKRRDDSGEGGYKPYKSFGSKDRFKSNDRDFSDRGEKKFSRDSKPYNSDRKSYGSKPDFNRSRSEGFSKRRDDSGEGGYKSYKSFGSKDRFKSNDRDFSDRGEKKFSRDSKPYNSDRKSYGSKPDFNRSRSEDSGEGSYKSYKSFGSKDRYKSNDRDFRDRGEKRFSRDSKPYNSDRKSYGSKPDFNRSRSDESGDGSYKSYKSFGSKDRYKSNDRDFSDRGEKKFSSDRKPYSNRKRYDRPDFGSKRKKFDDFDRFDDVEEETIDPNTPIRLNRAIANTGFCARREADEIIAEGRVTVNGNVVTEMGFKVTGKDKILLDGNKVESQRKVYILLNKPKDCVTTKKDPQGRRTAYSYIEGACRESVEAVGRLDRNTTGVLLFTNDGELHQQMAHASYNKMKIFHAFLDKGMGADDFEKIQNGIEIDGETIVPDDLQYVGDSKSEIGIQISSTQNHIIKQIFEAVGYKVEKLDRVYFAGLTKKNIPRGKYRILTEKEVNILKQGAYE